MEWRYSLILLCVLVTYTELKHYHSIAGPFKVVIRRLERCPPELEAKDKMTYSFKDVRTKYTELPTYSANASYPFYVNNTLSGAIRIASWSNMGGWKENAHILHAKPFCRNMEVLLPALWKAFRLSVYGEEVPCYFYPSILRFTNFTPTMKDIPVKHFFYGRWRADLIMEYQNGDVAACIRGYGDTVPV